MSIQCTNCGRYVDFGEEAAGRRRPCPVCGAGIDVPAKPAPTPPPPSPPQAATEPKVPAGGRTRTDRLILAGWICFGVGLLMLFALTPFLPLCGPLFLTSLIIGIVALFRARVGAGVALILCSTLVPMLIGLLILAGIFTAAPGSVEKLTSLPTPPPPRLVQSLRLLATKPPAPTSAPKATPAAPLEPITLSGFLSAMDDFARAHKDATTSLQKQKIREDAQRQAASMLENRLLTVPAVVADVSASRPGVTQIRFEGDNEDRVNRSMGRTIITRTSGGMDFALSYEKAIQITRGRHISLIGRAEFVPQNSVSLLSQPAPRQVMRILFPLDGTPIGYICLDDVKCGGLGQ